MRAHAPLGRTVLSIGNNPDTHTERHTVITLTTEELDVLLELHQKAFNDALAKKDTARVLQALNRGMELMRSVQS